jgi:hypothetical protein
VFEIGPDLHIYRGASVTSIGITRIAMILPSTQPHPHNHPILNDKIGLGGALAHVDGECPENALFVIYYMIWDGEQCFRDRTNDNERGKVTGMF